jgi:hypothetical protein
MRSRDRDCSRAKMSEVSASPGALNVSFEYRARGRIAASLAGLSATADRSLSALACSRSATFYLEVAYVICVNLKLTALAPMIQVCLYAEASRSRTSYAQKYRAAGHHLGRDQRRVRYLAGWVGAKREQRPPGRAYPLVRLYCTQGHYRKTVIHIK